MESAKPIEPIVPGCQAIIIGGDFIGEEVHVIRFIGKPVSWSEYNDVWEVADCGGGIVVITGSKLVRKPGLQKQIEAEEELVLVR